MQEKVIISEINSRPILDSRDEWTIETEINLSDGSSGIASVPSGKSKGSREAHTVSIHDAIAHIHGPLRKGLIGFSGEDQSKLDQRLIYLDGTDNKRHLGGNTLLSISIAFCKALSHSRRIEVWKLIREISNNKSTLKPRLFINVINGGLHAGNNLPFQEYIAIPKTTSYKEASEEGSILYQTLKSVLEEEKGKSSICLGDEGGFASGFRDPLEPFEVITKALERSNLQDKFDFGLDAAAGANRLSKTEMIENYEKMISMHNLIYLEDPFGENDAEDFVNLKSKNQSVIITGDDLTTTNAKEIEKYAKMQAISGVIIKPNQIGTISEALLAVSVAKDNGIKVVVSHRSGETNDDFIADFADGVSAFGFKLGSPARGERVAKYNRLLSIEEGY
jgi:enolase